MLSPLVSAPAPTHLAANLAGRKIRGVHIGIGEALQYGLQGRGEVTRGNTLSSGANNICCCDGSGDRARSGRRARRLPPAPAQENHHATRHVRRREVQVRDRWRPRQPGECEGERDRGCGRIYLHLERRGAGGVIGRHLVVPKKFCRKHLGSSLGDWAR